MYVNASSLSLADYGLRLPRKVPLSATFRQDGYSKLLVEQPVGGFPRPVGWVGCSKEDFMRNYDNIFSFLKIRASYGLNRNASGIGAYTLQEVMEQQLMACNLAIDGQPADPFAEMERSKTFWKLGMDIL